MFASPEVLAQDRTFVDLTASPDTLSLLAEIDKFVTKEVKPWQTMESRSLSGFNAIVQKGLDLELGSMLTLSHPNAEATLSFLQQMQLVEALGFGDLDVAFALLESTLAYHWTARLGLAAANVVVAPQARIDAHQQVLIDGLALLFRPPNSNANNTETIVLMPAPGPEKSGQVVSIRLTTLSPDSLINGLNFAQAQVVQDVVSPLQRHTTPLSGNDLFITGMAHMTTIAAMMTGAIRACVRMSFEYARTRQSFGKPIIQHQAVAARLADMLTLSELSKLTLERTAEKADTSSLTMIDVNMLEHTLSKAAFEVSRDAIQTHGGHGYTEGLPLAKLYRDLLVMRGHLKDCGDWLRSVHD